MFRSSQVRTGYVWACALLAVGLVALLLNARAGRTEPVAVRLASAPTVPAAGATPAAQARVVPAAEQAPATGTATPPSSVPVTRKASAVAAAPADTGTAGMTGMAGMVMPTPPVTAPILAPASPAGTKPSTKTPPRAQFHEFQADCTITDHRPDDPIVYPGLPGASHNHAFFGNTTTTAGSTMGSLQAGATSCRAPGDLTAYWMTTLYNGTKIIDPTGTIVYYKSDVIDYTSVRPFPQGLRFVAGSPTSTQAQFTHGFWSCGANRRISTIPATCEPGSRLFARYQAPSCWDGVHLDVPGHQSHMAYPVRGRCPADHPVALPMLEFKIPYPVNGNMSAVHLASGAGFTFHYDVINAWDDATQAALVKTCINGGLQCNARGYDRSHPQVPAALGPDYRLAP